MALFQQRFIFQKVDIITKSNIYVRFRNNKFRNNDLQIKKKLQ